MNELSPPAVYAHESVVAEARLKARLDRVVASLARPVEVTTYCDDELPALVKKGLVAGRVPMGTLADVPDPVLLFNTFRFDGRREERERWLDGVPRDVADAREEARRGPRSLRLRLRAERDTAAEASRVQRHRGRVLGAQGRL